MKASQLTKENITPEIVDKLLFEGLDYKGETADVIIVLGSRKACDYRVPLAAKLFHKGKAPKLVFCGGKVQKTSIVFSRSEIHSVFRDQPSQSAKLASLSLSCLNTI